MRPRLPARDTPRGRALWRVVETLDPSPAVLRARLRGRPRTPFRLTLVYRARHAALVRDLVSDVPADSSVVLWALDHEVPDLAPWTIGEGPGGRFALHQQMLARPGRPPGAHWFLADDDIVLRPGSLSLLATAAEALALDVYSPVHAAHSHFSHRHTCQQALTIARETPFVEIGPIVGFSPAAIETLVPFPDHEGVGWGMEGYWSSLTQRSLRTALVDAVRVDHTVPMGGAYDQAAEDEKIGGLLAQHGVATLHEMMVTTTRWRPWQKHQPWPLEALS